MNDSQIREWSQQFRISEAIITYISKTYPDSHDLETLLHAMTHAPSDYYLRINPMKIEGSSLVDIWNASFPDFRGILSPLPNTLKIPIHGPSTLPLHPKHVFCDKFAGEAVMIGADLYLPGVCGMNGKFPEKTEVSVLVAENHIPSKWQGDKVSFHVANGIMRKSSKDYVKERKGLFVQTHSARYQVAKYRNHFLFQQGFISEQTLPPIYAMGCLMWNVWREFQDSLDRLCILDTCAAPGHKSTAMVEWAKLIGDYYDFKWTPRIISMDRSSNRLKHLENDMKRLNLTGITPIASKLENISRNVPELQGKGNVVMFDPPCSALGTRPKLFIDETARTLEGYAKNQSRLLPYIDQLVKPGGLLMYNTCTISKEENEEIVGELVSSFGYEIMPLQRSPSSLLPSLGHDGFSTPNLSIHDSTQIRRFSPINGDHNGYFIALLKKNE